MEAPPPINITVIGPTTWGTTLAVLLAKKGLRVLLLSRHPAEAALLAKARENSSRLPGIGFPDSLGVTGDPAAALASADLLLLAVPSHTVRNNLRQIRPHLHPRLIIVNAGKGLELETNKRMSEVIGEESGPVLASRVCALSGPNLAVEIAAGRPASAVVASPNTETAALAQSVLMGPTFRVYTSDDLVGVELGGALKNVIALGAGICEGLGYGDNAKAALITRGLAEITRLGVALGASPLTFAGLAGLGDLVATCASRLSRNHQVGERLAAGQRLPDILASMNQVAEGVNTTVAARTLAAKLGVEMPIVEQMHQVLFRGQDPRRAVAELMTRGPKHELSGLRHSLGR